MHNPGAEHTSTTGDPLNQMGKNDILCFDFPEGKVLAGKYVIDQRIGDGWEGEVYKIHEIKTRIPRAAKFYYPVRNPKGKTATLYSQKLNRLADCRIIMQYAHQDWITYRRQRVEFLVSEYIEGQVLKQLLAERPGKRMPPFEAFHLLEALCRGMTTVHNLGEYHGDIHLDNILVQRKGLVFQVKLIDFFYWAGPKRENIFTDVLDLVRVLYDLVGGAKHYAKMPPQVKAICCGLKKSHIRRKFRTAGQLHRALLRMEW